MSIPVSPTGRRCDLHPCSGWGKSSFQCCLCSEGRWCVKRHFRVLLSVDLQKCCDASGLLWTSVACVSPSFNDSSSLCVWIPSLSPLQLMFPGFLSENLQQWVQTCTQIFKHKIICDHTNHQVISLLSACHYNRTAHVTSFPSQTVSSAKKTLFLSLHFALTLHMWHLNFQLWAVTLLDNHICVASHSLELIRHVNIERQVPCLWF